MRRKRKEKEKWEKGKEKGKRKKRSVRKEERGKRERERFAAPTAAGRARAPVERDARDEGKQEDVIAVGSDVGIGSGSGDRAGKK